MHADTKNNKKKQTSLGNVPFGGGYLTTHEANQILNHLPLEITFIDKDDVFKYFNEIVGASEMLFERTTDDIGIKVGSGHPSKSMEMVATLVHDLKTKKRSKESMWYKKKDQYIYITFTGVFDEDDVYLGVMEYVQDIQPFFDLPSEVKVGLSDLKA